MVSNLDRIFREIGRESERVAAEHDLQSDELTELVMAIVDVEDEHSFRNTNVKQRIKTLIQNFAGRTEKGESPEADSNAEGDGGDTQEDDR